MPGRKVKTAKPPVLYSYRYVPESGSVLLFFFDQLEPEEEKLGEYLYYAVLTTDRLKWIYIKYGGDGVYALSEAAIPLLIEWLEENPAGDRDLLQERTEQIIEDVMLYVNLTQLAASGNC